MAAFKMDLLNLFPKTDTGRPLNPVKGTFEFVLNLITVTKWNFYSLIPLVEINFINFFPKKVSGRPLNPLKGTFEYMLNLITVAKRNYLCPNST